MRRRTLVVLLSAAVAVSSGATWLAATVVQSPAEVAARTRPPDAQPILAPVVEQVLTNRVVTRGTGHYGSSKRLSLSPSRLKSGNRVITRLPRDGALVAAGDVLMTVSGRPVFLLEGAQPSYRDLGPGMTGRDVRQLELALDRLGTDPGLVDGRYDAATASAVARLYARHSFPPLVASAEQVARHRPREADLVPGALAGPGVQMPADELVFVETAPLRVTGLPARVGGPPRGPVVTVTGSDVVIEGQLPAEQAGLVRTGARVVIDEPALALQGVGRVARVAPRPGTDGADGFHVSFEVAVAKPPPGLVGASVRLVVPIESTGTAELTVPVSAVSLGAHGGARVQRSADGTTAFVPVRTGLAADGFVTVTPTSGDLTAGDMVVVGVGARARGGR